MEIPILLFLGFIGMSFIFVVIGLVKKVPAGVVIGGMFILSIAIMTDKIVLGQTIEETDNTITSINRQLLVNQDFSNTNGALQSGSNIRIAEYVNGGISPLSGLDVNTISIQLSKTGSPNSLGTVGIQNTVAGTYVKVFGLFNTTMLTTTPTWFNFSLPDGEVLILNSTHRITVDYSGGASVNVRISTLNVYPQSICQASTGTVWANCASLDLAFRLYGGAMINENTINTLVDNTFEFTAFIKMIFGLFSAILMLFGGLMVYKTD